MNIQFLKTIKKVWVLICLPKCFWFITIFIWDRKKFLYDNLQTCWIPLSCLLFLLDILCRRKNILLLSLHILQLALVKLLHSKLNDKGCLIEILTIILTIAMSCLAAGFSTGVTSFRPLVSAPWIADSSSELGLHSDMVELGRLTRREGVILSNRIYYRRWLLIRGLISNQYLIRNAICQYNNP